MNASGTWSTGTNWSGSTVPGTAAGDVVNINYDITNSRTVTLTGTQTMGVLNIGDTTLTSGTYHSFTVASSGSLATLIFNNSGSAAQINSTGTTNSFNSAAITYRLTNGGLNINNLSGGSTTLSFAAGTFVSAAASGTQTITTTNNSSSALTMGTINDGSSGGKVALNTAGGLVVLTNTNSFTGGLTISRSQVRANATGVGQGVIQIGDLTTATGTASLQAQSGTYANNIIVGAAGGPTTGTTSIAAYLANSSALFTGSVTLNRTLIITPGFTSTYAFSGPISGTGSLFASSSNGINTLNISGSNSFSGGLRTADSYLYVNIGHANAVGTGTWTLGSTSSNQSLDFRFDNTSGSAMTMATNNVLSINNMTFVGSNDMDLGTGAVSIAGTSAIVTVLDKQLTIGGVLSASRRMGNAGSGTLALTAANTYTGATTVGGVLSVTSLANGGTASNIGASTNSGTNLILNRGRLLYSGTGATTDRLFTVGNGGATIDSAGTGAMNFSNTGALISTDTVSLTIGNGSASVGFVPSGTIINGIDTANLAVGMTITGSNITPGTTISQILDGGRVVISTAASGSSVSSTYVFGALDRTLTLTGTNSGNNTIAGQLVDASSKTLGVTKNGSGKWILSGSNTYTGNTAVNAGTLVIAATGRLSNSSAVTVAGGGQFAYNSSAARTGSITLNGSGSNSRAILSGTGAINTALVLDDVGDTLSPGNSPGVLNLGVGQTWESFTYQWETNDFVTKVAGTNFDQIAITGGLTLTGDLGDYVLDLYSLTASNVSGFVGNFVDEEQSWIILTTTAGITGFNAANWNILTDNFTSNPAWTGNWSLAQSGNDLVLTYAVPEPRTTSTLILASIGLMAVVFRRRIRRD